MVFDCPKWKCWKIKNPLGSNLQGANHAQRQGNTAILIYSPSAKFHILQKFSLLPNYISAEGNQYENARFILRDPDCRAKTWSNSILKLKRLTPYSLCGTLLEILMHSWFSKWKLFLMNHGLCCYSLMWDKAFVTNWRTTQSESLCFWNFREGRV